MRLVENQDFITVWSPCKVNLFLEIHGKRADGYHELVTIMQQIDLCDRLELRKTDDDVLSFKCEHPLVPADETNLVVRAANRLRETADISSGAAMTLEKIAPVGGGLGGGSANAAAALIGLNRLWDAGLSSADLHRLAAELGSDVNLFLEEGTCLCTGRGEQVERLFADCVFNYVVVMPEFGVSTPEVFRAHADSLLNKNQDVSIALKALGSGDFDEICGSLFNRLEAPAFALYPELEELKHRLEEVAPGRALMSGSGSTFYVLCPDEDDAIRLERYIAEMELGTVCRASTLAAS